MSYKVTINGKTYDLPPRTLTIDDMIERVSSVGKRYAKGESTRREIVQEQFDFLAACAPGAFTDVETADTNDLLIATLEVLKIYNAPAIKARNEATLQEIRGVVNTPEMTKVVDLARAKK
ncbi:hypothetical protein [uncultured Agathobaculum sp.]|uniref:hypothetical protein n=1 Tax=uncultured Agathobaculum sp. TaxID=2048140 RepID=UPI00320810B8